MTITAVEAIPVRIRRDYSYLGSVPPGVEAGTYFRRPSYRTLYSAYFETAFVKITTSDGAVGWGEALAPVAPDVVATIVQQLLSPVLIGSDPLSINVLWNTMYDLMRERGYYGGFMLDAISACDSALWDVCGQLLNQPVYKLLGGPYSTEVPCYVSGFPSQIDDERAAIAQGFLDQGFQRFKLHAGYGVEKDLITLRRLRETIGPDGMLMFDAHWAYTVSDCLKMKTELERLNIAWIEAPLNPEDVEGHARLVNQIGIPITIGETERTRYQFRPWLVQHAADVLQPDVGRTGISELVKIAHMAEAFNVRIAPHLSVGLGPCIAAAVHAAASISNLWLLEYQPPVFDVANSLLEAPLVCEKGVYQLPEGPGLGVKLSESKLRDAQA